MLHLVACLLPLFMSSISDIVAVYLTGLFLVLTRALSLPNLAVCICSPCLCIVGVLACSHACRLAFHTSHLGVNGVRADCMIDAVWVVV